MTQIQDVYNCIAVNGPVTLRDITRILLADSLYDVKMFRATSTRIQGKIYRLLREGTIEVVGQYTPTKQEINRLRDSKTETRMSRGVSMNLYDVVGHERYYE